MPEDKLPIRMLHDRVLVQLDKDAGERRSSGGIVIPATAALGARRLSWCRVVAVGAHVRSVEVDGLLAKVEIDVTQPARVVAIITRESADELALKPGMSAAGVVKATSVMVER